MSRSAVLLALLSLCVCACSRSAPVQQVARTAPPAVTQPQPAPAKAETPPTTPQSEAEQATTAQESGADDDAQPTRGDTSLERIAALSPAEQLPGGKWKPGVNYDPVVPAQTTSAGPGKVEVIEVFWLGCPHCYALEPYVLKWLKSKPSYISFVRVPVMWGPVHRAHARFYYTLLALNHADLFEKAFDTIHRDNNPLVANTDDATFNLQLAFATANGIKADDFTKAYRSMAVNTDLLHAQDVTDRYNITGVPAFVVDGKYTTDVSKAGSPENLFAIVDDLAAADHHH